MAFSALRHSAVRSGTILENNFLKRSFINNGKTGSARPVGDASCQCTPTMCSLTFNKKNQLIRDYSKHAKHQTGKKFDSDSDSDSDFEILGHRGESDFWRRKMRTFHGILDVNNDGVISYEDFQLLADRFVNLGHLTEKHTNEFKTVIKELWERQWGNITPYVTVEQYLEDMHHVLNDKNKGKRAHAFLPYLFKAVDKRGAGQIQLDEFVLFFECLGQSEKDAILAFRAIDTNSDGKITIQEFVKHGKDFFLTEDENRISKYFWGPLVDH